MPLGTILSTFSAMTIPPSQEAGVRFGVVMNSDPPSCNSNIRPILVFQERNIFYE